MKLLLLMDNSNNCGICLEKCIVPCKMIHKGVDCNQVFCEECIIPSDRCPVCNDEKTGYTILLRMINYNETIICPRCNWKGTVSNYMYTHAENHRNVPTHNTNVSIQ